jgi:hypothetical protein
MNEPPIQDMPLPDEPPAPAGPEPIIDAQIVSDDTQAAKWFTIAFMIAIVLLTIFAIVFWVSFVRSNIFGAS